MATTATEEYIDLMQAEIADLVADLEQLQQHSATSRQPEAPEVQQQIEWLQYLITTANNLVAEAQARQAQSAEVTK